MACVLVYTYSCKQKTTQSTQLKCILVRLIYECSCGAGQFRYNFIIRCESDLSDRTNVGHSRKVGVGEYRILAICVRSNREPNLRIRFMSCDFPYADMETPGHILQYVRRGRLAPVSKCAVRLECDKMRPTYFVRSMHTALQCVLCNRGNVACWVAVMFSSTYFFVLAIDEP